MEFKDYYQILGVSEDADAKAIKTAYRKLARKYHPDLSEEDEAEERFKEVAEAYEVLKDKDKRAEFDALKQYGGTGGFKPPPGWQGGGSQSSGGEYQGGFSDFFEDVFGQAPHGSQQGYSRQHFTQRGEDIDLVLPVFLEEAYRGETRTISFRVPQFDSNHRLSHQDKTLKVKIPAGTIDGERIRLKGQGAPGIGSAPDGDLYLKIEFAEHPLYTVDGASLTMTVPIAPWEAALGTKLEIPTLDGKVNLSVPINSQNGKRLRLKGKGLGLDGKRGDLYVILGVTLPQNASDKESELWHQLAEASNFDPRENWGMTA
jgi:curved DNA-binding protein